MRKSKRTLAALASLALLPLAACKDSSGPSRNLVGEMHFTYTGAVSGEFDAEGKVSAANVESGTFAFGEIVEDPEGGDALLLYSQEGRSSSDKYDAMLIVLDGPAKGTFTCTEADTDCAFMSAFAMGQDDSTTDDADALFVGTSGQFTITEIDDDRIRGTFTLSMLGYSGVEEEVEVEVKSGTFDLPLLEPGDVSLSQAAFGVLQR
jgi:hypothetical protein